MKLVTYVPAEPRSPKDSRVGILVDGRVFDLADGFDRIGLAHEAKSVRHLLESSAAWARREEAAQALLDASAPSHSVHEVQLLAPLPHPRSLRDCLAYEGHLRQCGRTVLRRTFRPLAGLDALCHRLWGGGLVPIPKVWYEQPVYYKGNPASVVGSGHEIRWPSYTDLLDFELELAVVIGRPGLNIDADRAADYIAGYTIFNDFSARDVQLREMKGRLGPAKGKDFDTGNVLGPVLVTIDEIGAEPELATRVVVNGDIWSEGSTGGIQFSIGEILAWISRDETLYPGDVIGLGTVPGGCGLELNRWIQPGDTVELTIDGIGTLSNRIGSRATGGD